MDDISVIIDNLDGVSARYSQLARAKCLALLRRVKNPRHQPGPSCAAGHDQRENAASPPLTITHEDRDSRPKHYRPSGTTNAFGIAHPD
jgi:hypothetical protein